MANEQIDQEQEAKKQALPATREQQEGQGQYGFRSSPSPSPSPEPEPEPKPSDSEDGSNFFPDPSGDDAMRTMRTRQRRCRQSE